ncbi:MAG: hypothetical protein ACFCUJ_14180 [Thiotrichales bacterium]
MPHYTRKSLPLLLMLAMLLHLLPASLWAAPTMAHGDGVGHASESVAAVTHHDMAASDHACCDDPIERACDCGGDCANPACQCPVGVNFAPIVESTPIKSDKARPSPAPYSTSLPLPAPSPLERPPRLV